MLFAIRYLLNACNVSSTSFGSSSTSRISGASTACTIRLQCEEETGALPDGALGPNPAAVTVDDPLDGREADTCAVVVLSVMKSLEHAKQLIHVAHVEAGSVVADQIYLLD